MEKRVKNVFIGLTFLFLAAGMFLLYYGDRYFPSGEILGIPLSFWKWGSLVFAVLVMGAQRFVEWYSRMDPGVLEGMDKVFLWLIIVLIILTFITYVAMPDEMFGISRGYWLGGLIFSILLSFVGWVFVVWDSRKD